MLSQALLHLKGYAVDVWFVGKESSMTEETRLQKQIRGPLWSTCKRTGRRRLLYGRNPADAIFGIGLSRQVSGTYANVIENLKSDGCHKSRCRHSIGTFGRYRRCTGNCIRSRFYSHICIPKDSDVVRDGAQACRKACDGLHWN